MMILFISFNPLSFSRESDTLYGKHGAKEK